MMRVVTFTNEASAESCLSAVNESYLESVAETNGLDTLDGKVISKNAASRENNYSALTTSWDVLKYNDSQSVWWFTEPNDMSNVITLHNGVVITINDEWLGEVV